jgi:hypothetical protein
MNLAEAYKSVRQGIVAFCLRDPDKARTGSTHFEHVFGTGFIIDDSIIATNAHVARMFSEVRKQGNDVAAIAFIRKRHAISPVILNISNSCIVKNVVPQSFYYGPPAPDLAIVLAQHKGLSRFALKLKEDAVPEGTHIGTAGFPMGPEMLHLEGRLDHASPTLQAGVISASLPFPECLPHGYLINVMAQGGASGSPVFLSDTGEVIGVSYARHLEQVQIGQAGPQVWPTNFSYVVPAYMVMQLLAQGREEMLKRLQPDASHIDAILASQPEIPTNQLTYGEYQHTPDG